MKIENSSTLSEKIRAEKEPKVITLALEELNDLISRLRKRFDGDFTHMLGVFYLIKELIGLIDFPLFYYLANGGKLAFGNGMKGEEDEERKSDGEFKEVSYIS